MSDNPGLKAVVVNGRYVIVTSNPDSAEGDYYVASGDCIRDANGNMLLWIPGNDTQQGDDDA